ncbi:retropepsin-like aspartic protease family protein [Sphingomonas soli]|uniref:retropepsin-like aspartic protease family protein n=1 Tax=Sphingomonas soli TaxID=266127 RepID=UPI000ACB2D62|nr:TIGR02281 family clan AA aspartic protease [Sphingomonas soli]
MNDDLLSGILLVGVLVLAARAMLTRRASFATVLGSLFSWAAIGLVLFMGYNHRQEIDGFFARIGGYEEQRAEGGTVRIRKARDGHFWANVKLNGMDRRMLIDSGATVIALSTATAKAAGIEPRKGPPVLIETANGTVEAGIGKLEKLEIGPLRAEDLEVTISDNLGEVELLGMNFLSRLKSWRVQGDELILEPDGATGPIEAAPEQDVEPPTRAANGERPTSRTALKATATQD